MSARNTSKKFQSILDENGQALITVMSLDELQKNKEDFPRHKEFLHSISSIRYCKADAYKDCVVGTMRVPQKHLEHTQQMSFGYYMTEQSLVFVEGTGDLRQWLNKQTDLLRDLSAPDQILLQLFEKLIDDDRFYLFHLEKELAGLEETLIHDVPEDFFVTFTKYRQKLSEFNAYYEQLIDIGEQMQSNACHALVRSAEAWANFTRRAERHLNHVRLLRETIVQLRELYQARQDEKRNRVMDILTIITTLFLPLTLLTGWYGMNFDYMPELNWQYSYLVVFGIAVVIVICEIVYFKRKKFF